MENWRRFLKENKNPSKLEHYYRAIEEAKDNPQALEEGMAEAVLAAIMAFGSAGGNNVEVNGMLISPEEATQAVHMIQRLDKNKYTEAPDAIQEIGDIFTSATKNLEQGLDGDGDGNVGTVAGGDYQLNDGSGDLRFGQSGEPLALAALQKADNASSASPSDTGSPDTGATAATRTNWDGVLMNLSNGVGMGGGPERMNKFKAQAEMLKAQAPDSYKPQFDDIINTINAKLAGN